MRSSLLLALWLAGLGVAGCGASAQTPAHPVAVEARPVPLNPDGPKLRRAGALTFAGGVVLTAPGEAGFGGLSGLDVHPDGTFLSQTDAGDIVSGRIVLDSTGKLTGVADVAIARLTDEQGEPYATKNAADAEDITFLPDGGFAVSFEQNHRVLAYTGDGKARRLGIPAEAAEFDNNSGLEALTAWTDASGRQRLVEGAEDGRAWSCDPQGRDCRLFLRSEDRPRRGFNLTSLDALPDGGGLIAVYRAFDLIQGMRAIVAWVRPDGPRRVTTLALLAPPFTIDNMEGVAALRNPDGSIRIYIVSDNNFSQIQRTLLLAFDWKGPGR